MKKEYPFNKNYIVYDDGRIYSKRFKKFLTPKVNHDGYHRIQIWKDNKCKYIAWHRIIAETFIPNPKNKPVINHIDGDKTNNYVSNLEWCTQSENIQHAFKTGLSKTKPVDMLDMEGNYLMSFKSAIEAGEYINRHGCGITKCCKGTQTHVNNFKWRYSETSND